MPLVRFSAKTSGFTLIELLVTVALVGILAAIAGPSIRDMTLNNRLVTETNDMLADFLFMRSEAIKRSKSVYMCKTADPNAASPTCDTNDANPWSTGWLIYVNDDSGVTTYDSTTDDILLRVGDGFSGGNNAIKTTADDASTALANEVIISRLGLLLNDSAGYFSICDSRGASYAKRIDIGTSGKPRINRKDDPSC